MKIIQRLIAFTILILCLGAEIEAQVWSPSGNKLAFFYIHSIEDIYLVNPDGSNFQILDKHPERDFSIQWAPNGEKLNFTSIRDGNHELYVMNEDGTGLKRITDTPEFKEVTARWSPKGNRIMFIGAIGEENWDVWTVDLDGKNGPGSRIHRNSVSFIPPGNMMVQVSLMLL